MNLLLFLLISQSDLTAEEFFHVEVKPSDYQMIIGREKPEKINRLGVYLLFSELIGARETGHTLKNGLAHRGLRPDAIQRLVSALETDLAILPWVANKLRESRLIPEISVEALSGDQGRQAANGVSKISLEVISKSWLRLFESRFTPRENSVITSFINETLTENLIQWVPIRHSESDTKPLLIQGFSYFELTRDTHRFRVRRHMSAIVSQSHFSMTTSNLFRKKLPVPNGLFHFDRSNTANIPAGIYFSSSQMGLEEK